MSHFIKDRVYLVDSVKSNYLIRGPVPLNQENKFVYNEIINHLDVKINKLIVISLIDSVGESSMLSNELKSFNLNPNLFGPESWPPYTKKEYDSRKMYGNELLDENGKFHDASLIWWPIEGIGENQEEKDFLFYPGWNFSGLVDYIIKLLQQEANQTGIYFHCSLGADRTGAVTAGYLMRSKHINADYAIDLVSKQTSAGKPALDYLNLINSYGKLLNKMYVNF